MKELTDLEVAMDENETLKEEVEKLKHFLTVEKEKNKENIPTQTSASSQDDKNLQKQGK